MSGLSALGADSHTLTVRERWFPLCGYHRKEGMDAKQMKKNGLLHFSFNR
jgi:hypothetical protein